MELGLQRATILRYVARLLVAASVLWAIALLFLVHPTAYLEVDGSPLTNGVGAYGPATCLTPVSAMLGKAVLAGGYQTFCPQTTNALALWALLLLGAASVISLGRRLLLRPPDSKAQNTIAADLWDAEFARQLQRFEHNRTDAS